MDIILNRSGGVPVRDQIVAQIELRILDGTLAHGQRLPSVRALARRLKVHANTVSAAYQDLEHGGQVLLKRGSGVFVRGSGPSQLDDARGLDEMIRLALRAAFRKGFSGAQIREAVERWLKASPPTQIVVVDPSHEMAELLVRELKLALPSRIALAAASLDELARNPALLSGALAIVLPYHVERVAQLAPGAAVETVTLHVPDAERKVILSLPDGAIVLVVSHSPTVLPFATVVLKSLRGDELHVETRLLSATREWKRLAPVADVVFADALAAETVARARPRRLREFRVLSPPALERLRDALTVVVPEQR